VKAMKQHVDDYFSALGSLPGRALASGPVGLPIPAAVFVEEAAEAMRAAVAQGGKLMFVGNGGSASICSHMAVDFSKNAGLPALAFNDGAVLTCLSNDLGYERVFAKQVEMYGRPEDLLVAISSSGNSANILNAVEAARRLGCRVVTLSGFRPDNRLRSLGDWNLYLPAGEYGFVEIVHLAFCHAILDLAMGWTAETGLWTRLDTPKEAAA